MYQIDDMHAKRIYGTSSAVGKNSIIEGDLNSQKEIVLKGNYQLEDGASVRPEEAPAEEEEDEDD